MASARTLENGFDQGLPDLVEQTEVAAGDDHEAEHDGGGLADLAAVRPLHAPQLVDAVAEEREQAVARTALLGLDVDAAAAARGRVALDGVGRAIALVVVVELVLVDAGAAVVAAGRRQPRLGQARLVDLGRGVAQRVGRRGALAQGRVDRVVIRSQADVAGDIVGATGLVLTTTPAPLAITSHCNASLARLAMPGMAPAPLAELPQGDAIRIVALGLVGLIVPALALLACEGDGDPDVSAGHW